MSGFMEPIKANKFVVFETWWRLEAYADCMVNHIFYKFASVRFAVESIKLHALTYGHHVKNTKLDLMESVDEDINRHLIGVLSCLIRLFYCILSILI